MGVPIVEALTSHELAEITSISSQTSDSDTHMIINIENFFLMVGQIMRTLFQRHENLKQKSQNKSVLELDNLLVNDLKICIYEVLNH